MPPPDADDHARYECQLEQLKPSAGAAHLIHGAEAGGPESQSTADVSAADPGGGTTEPGAQTPPPLRSPQVSPSLN